MSDPEMNAFEQWVMEKLGLPAGSSENEIRLRYEKRAQAILEEQRITLGIERNKIDEVLLRLRESAGVAVLNGRLHEHLAYVKALEESRSKLAVFIGKIEVWIKQSEVREAFFSQESEEGPELRM